MMVPVVFPSSVRAVHSILLCSRIISTHLQTDLPPVSSLKAALGGGCPDQTVQATLLLAPVFHFLPDGHEVESSILDSISRHSFEA